MINTTFNADMTNMMTDTLRLGRVHGKETRQTYQTEHVTYKFTSNPSVEKDSRIHISITLETLRKFEDKLDRNCQLLIAQLREI